MSDTSPVRMKRGYVRMGFRGLRGGLSMSSASRGSNAKVNPRKTDVAKGAADIVLTDDNFASIAAAVEEGRAVFANLTKFIVWTLPTNAGQSLIILASILTGLALPVLPVQLLWVNIVTDGAPALALGLDRDSAVMRQRPRDPQSPLLDQGSLRFILMAGCTLAVVGGVLLLVMPRLGFTLPQTRTAIFLHITIGQLFYAYPARRNIVSGAPPRFNGALHLAVVLGIGLQLLTVLVPGLRLLLGLEPLTLKLLLLVITSVLLAWGVAEAYIRLAK